MYQINKKMQQSQIGKNVLTFLQVMNFESIKLGMMGKMYRTKRFLKWVTFDTIEVRCLRIKCLGVRFQGYSLLSSPAITSAVCNGILLSRNCFNPDKLHE